MLIDILFQLGAAIWWQNVKVHRKLAKKRTQALLLKTAYYQAVGFAYQRAKIQNKTLSDNCARAERVYVFQQTFTAKHT